jgi:hypothetical protein
MKLDTLLSKQGHSTTISNFEHASTNLIFKERMSRLKDNQTAEIF